MSYLYTFDRPIFSNSPTMSYILIASEKEVFPAVPFTQLQLSSQNGAPSRFLIDSNNSSSLFGSSIRGRRTHGTSTSASGLISGDVMLQSVGDGYDGNLFTNNSVAIVFKASDNWSSSYNPTIISFRNTLKGAISSSESMLINDDGFISGSFFGNVKGTASFATSASWAPGTDGSGTTLFTGSTYQITSSYANNVVGQPKIQYGIVSGSIFSGSNSNTIINLPIPSSDTIYNIQVTGEDVRVWSVGNRTTSSFTIYSNSSMPLEGYVFWHTIF